ncbi:hypothetical protein [Legionella sp. W05-934-2]|uniref:hypothetical protein n=1 Tax=Legionella sp. W05-934-2 TaxID=1198649 RepID=UPI0034631D44
MMKKGTQLALAAILGSTMASAANAGQVDAFDIGKVFDDGFSLYIQPKNLIGQHVKMIGQNNKITGKFVVMNATVNCSGSDKTITLMLKNKDTGKSETITKNIKSNSSELLCQSPVGYN